jgi:hypothetical protein
MPASDYYECMAYECLEPFGGRRGDVQAGIVAATIANANRSKNAKPFSPADFIPEWEAEPVEQQSPEQQLAMIQLLQAGQNARKD